jgi:hypothetical protein
MALATKVMAEAIVAMLSLIPLEMVTTNALLGDGLVPMVINTYDPTLGGINCDQDCTRMGVTPIQDYHWDWAAACPVEWRGLEVVVPGVGRWSCWDSGGLIDLRLDPRNGYAVFIDVLSHTPGQWKIPAGEWYLVDPNAPKPTLIEQAK